MKFEWDENKNQENIRKHGHHWFIENLSRINIDKETSDWYESQGIEAKDLMSAALKIYAEAHREIHR